MKLRLIWVLLDIATLWLRFLRHVLVYTYRKLELWAVRKSIHIKPKLDRLHAAIQRVDRIHSSIRYPLRRRDWIDRFNAWLTRHPVTKMGFVVVSVIVGRQLGFYYVILP